MAWLTEQAEETPRIVDDRWLKIPDPEAVGKSTEVTIRFLDATPEDTWRHWLEDRMFNCPGMNDCPVCKVRNPLLKIDREAAQKQYRTDHRFFANVLHEGRVKIFSFGPGIAKQLLVFINKYADKYGDITSYDVSIQKRKTGRLPQNVEYTVIPEVPPRELSEEEQNAAEDAYDLKFAVTPASREDLYKVSQGELPPRPEPVEVPEEPQAIAPKVAPSKATKADIALLKATIKAKDKDLDLEHFGISEGDEIDKAVVDQLIADLGGKKR
jgi:hypothetical protein